MIISKARSAKIVGMRPRTPFLVATDKQLCSAGTHVERYCGLDYLDKSKTNKKLKFTRTTSITKPRM
jgi:hypothetical protein